ncbi:MAG: AbrB/MazE/SpoVT family DNA-binding domain-containing protein, partial [Candidatus Thermoplasmatota archaeon]|nr:AbrB/MazE/SpoVT family DNA-binding domain-containing protein [Candidatus Thermoplasmatota archaeon]
KKIDYLYEDLYLGKFEADVCNQCGEAFFTENAMNKIEKKAKEIGIRGLERKTKISRSGNSLIIRIPKAIAEFVGAKDGTSVTIRPGGKSKLIVAME